MTGFRAGIIRQLYNKKQPFQTSVIHGCFGRKARWRPEMAATLVDKVLS